MAVKEISKELSVSAIIEGSVRLSGDTMRITAQLIEAEEDVHFWSETWDSKDPKNSHITLIGLAYDSGFNSKTVFNTSLKRKPALHPNNI